MNYWLKSLCLTLMCAVLVIAHVEAAVVTIDPGGNGTIDAIFSPDGTYIYTGRNIDGKVTAIRTSDYSVAAEVSVGYNPLGLCTAGNGAYLYVSNTVNGSYTTKIDTKTFQVSANIPGGTDPAYMALTPDGSTLLITSHWSPFLQLVSVETDQEWRVRCGRHAGRAVRLCFSAK
jgi:YVTN family beta-propeller protein